MIRAESSYRKRLMDQGYFIEDFFCCWSSVVTVATVPYGVEFKFVWIRTIRPHPFLYFQLDNTLHIDKYRICFYFEDGNAKEVEIVDYH
jgi:hypothetical protein